MSVLAEHSIARRRPLDALRGAEARVLLLAALAVVAFNLRTPMASLPPLLAQVRAALGLSGFGAGLLTALPVLCMALCAPPAHRLAHRVGSEAMTLWAVALVAAGSLLRLGGGAALVLFAGTLAAGIGIAVCGVTIPSIIKDRFPNRPGAAAAAYSVPMMLGATLAPALAIPLAHSLGSWQGSLGSWAIPAVFAAAIWAPLARRASRRPAAPAATSGRLPWRSRGAWLLAAFLSVQSMLAYAYLAWLAPAYTSRGWSPVTSGTLLAALQLAQLATALALPPLADRMRDRRPVLVSAVACTAVGAIMLFAAPGAVPWVATTLLGLGLGGGFSLALVLLADLSASPAAASRLAAMTFLVCYSAGFARAGVRRRCARRHRRLRRSVRRARDPGVRRAGDRVALPPRTPRSGDMSAFDVITMGRIGVDVYPLQTGVSLREVESFGKYLGGSATNVAVAAARYGRRSAVITRTGDDPFGAFLHDALRRFGVDDRWVSAVPGLPTPVTFCEIFPPDDFPLYFYREPKAPDLEIAADELDLDAIRAATVFWVTVTGLSQEPSRSATLAALEARAGAGITILDLDYRPMFWRSREEARRWVQTALPYVTVAVGNQDEAETAVGVRDPRAAAQALREHGVNLAVVKQGPRGVLAHDGQSVVEVPPVPVEVVNGLGAGDAFGGALCHGLLAGWELEHVMRFCNAAGALVASRLACADAMPGEDEVDGLLGEVVR